MRLTSLYRYAPARSARVVICLFVALVAGTVVAGCDNARSTPASGIPTVGITSQPAAQPSSLEESPFTGYRAPNFTLVDLDGHSVTLRDFLGHPVWINLWATWCVPCKSEMPAMQKLENRYKAQGLVILGVDAQEDRSPVATYVQQGGYDWHFLLDPDSLVRTKYLFSGVPSHVFIDRAGTIRAISIGELDNRGMETYLARIVDPVP